MECPANGGAGSNQFPASKNKVFALHRKDRREMNIEKRARDFGEALNNYMQQHKSESGEFWRGFDAGVRLTQGYEIKRGQKRLKLAMEMAEQAQEWVKERNERRVKL